MQIKVGVTGVSGQLGSALVRALHEQGWLVVGCARGASAPFDAVDCSVAGNARAWVLKHRPSVVIHTAAWTQVDAAEEANNVARVYAINVQATEELARVCQEVGAKLLFVSTDYVFDGSGDIPWTEKDPVAPLNAYGRSKALAEEAVRRYCSRHFIVRLSWLFGGNGSNFVLKMVDLAKTHSRLFVVDDQWGRPTYAEDAAKIMVEMVRSEHYGTYHLSNEGEFITWKTFAQTLFAMMGNQVEVVGVSSEDYSMAAQRPRNSRLNTGLLATKDWKKAPPWKEALERYLKLKGLA